MQGLGSTRSITTAAAGTFSGSAISTSTKKNGRESRGTYKRIVARLHEAGIGSILHTYAFFVDKQSKYVTPVPHPQLDAFRSFTLAGPVDAGDTEITVVESTADVSPVTGFFERNSATLHIGDELVTFTGTAKEPPYTFTGCRRGAQGTATSAHAAGAQARHLKECFGLFVPDCESELFEEIAGNHAAVVDSCGFDGFYLDAIDGSDILRGGDEAWYWGQRFVFLIYKHLRKPVSMEMSSMWHQMWNLRSRWQAWDYPNRGQKRSSTSTPMRSIPGCSCRCIWAGGTSSVTPRRRWTPPTPI